VITASRCAFPLGYTSGGLFFLLSILSFYYFRFYVLRFSPCFFLGFLLFINSLLLFLSYRHFSLPLVYIPLYFIVFPKLCFFFYFFHLIGIAPFLLVYILLYFITFPKLCFFLYFFYFLDLIGIAPFLLVYILLYFIAFPKLCFS